MDRPGKLAELKDALRRQAAVAILGPRQVGKTTLARDYSDEVGAVYLDLERPNDQMRLRNPEQFFNSFSDRLVVLDEIHRLPMLFEVLRGVIDRRRRAGQRPGQFLLLGSASLTLIRQSSESLAGRLAYVHLHPFGPEEIASTQETQDQLWLRGGFPDSYLAPSDDDSLQWRQEFIQTYLQRDVPFFAPRILPSLMQRFWMNLSHRQGALLNAADLARALEVSQVTVKNYIDLLEALLLVRCLRPLHANLGKRLVKSPKVYFRDSGVVHALQSIRTHFDLLGHPVAGASWEGHVIENLINAAGPYVQASFYRTSAGAEMDLILDLPNRRRWAFEIKRSAGTNVTRGFHNARADLKPDRTFVVHGDKDRFPLDDTAEYIGLREMVDVLRSGQLQQP